MPTYHYRCPDCGHDFERFHKMTVTTRPKCPECGARTERVISGGAGLVFKGSGFYLTDYGRAGQEKTGDESGAKSGKADKPDRKAEKPDKSDAGTKSSSSEKPAKPSKSSGAES